MPLNRLVALATALLTLVLALVPVLGDMDWTSTAGVLAGIGAVAAVALKWLSGWQAYEARSDDEPAVDTSSPAERTPQALHVNLAG